MPARDEADEIVCTMLVHLLERVGYRADFLELGPSAQMLAQVAEQRPAIVCLSALPPFATADSRKLYRALRAQSPELKIVVGLWDGALDPNRTPIRIGRRRRQQSLPEILAESGFAD